MDPLFSPCHNLTICLLLSKSQLLMVLFFGISFYLPGKLLGPEAF